MLSGQLVGRRAVVAFLLPTAAFILSTGEGSVFDTPAENVTSDDILEYAMEVGIATAGLGIGLSVIFGLVTFIAMLVMCCRCKRLHRADLAIAEAEGDNNGKGLDDMYEIEDYEDKISKHRKILWGFSFFIFLGYLFCAGYAYNGAKTADSFFNKFFDGTDALLTDVQKALCAENGGSDCAENSVGDFMLDIADAVIDQLESIVDFISSLSVVVAPLYWVSANLSTAGTVIDDTESAIFKINNTIESVNLILTGDGKVGELSGDGVAYIDVGLLDDVDEGRTALVSAEEMTAGSRVEVAEQLSGQNSTIVRVKYQLDDISGNEIGDDEDLRNTTLATIYDDVLLPMRDITEDIYDEQNGQLVDVRELIDEYLEMSVQAVAGIIFLPGVVLFLTALCSGLFQSSKPLYLNMVFVFWIQILFCLAAGVFLALSKINRDICERHLEMLEANIEETLIATVRGVELTMNYDTAYLILTCDGTPSKEPTATNNLVSILGAQQIFNISAQLEDASVVITDNSNVLSSPKESVVSAQGELSPLTDFVTMDIAGDAGVAEASEDINTLLEELPPSPFDWDSRAHQDSLDDFYLKNVTDFSWNNESTGEATYREQLEEVNDLIAIMVPGVIGGPDFLYIKDPYNFTQARSLTAATVCAESSNFFPDPADRLQSEILATPIYTYEKHWDHLCGNVSAYANLTEALEEIISENDEARVELEEVSYNLNLIEGNLTTISGLQDQMALLRDDMNGSLAFLAQTLDDLVVDLNDLAAEFLSLNDVVMGASNYTMCGYIGTFYETVYLDATCTDLQANVEAVAGPALCVVILMFISFCVQGCYGPSMRKRPRGTAGDFDAGRTHLNVTNSDNNLPTPHSPTPLVGNTGF